MKMYLLSNIFISESNVLHNDKVSTWVICLDAADVKKKKEGREELRFCLGPEWGRDVSRLAYSYSCSAEQVICSADKRCLPSNLFISEFNIWHNGKGSARYIANHILAVLIKLFAQQIKINLLSKISSPNTMFQHEIFAETRTKKRRKVGLNWQTY